MLTCSLAFLSASNSFCNLSAFSSAPSACSCKNLIFRLTASSDVAPAIVYCITIFFFLLSVKTKTKKEKRGDCTMSCSTISEKLSSSEMTSLIVPKAACRGWTVRKLSGGALCNTSLFVQEVPLISKLAKKINK